MIVAIKGGFDHTVTLGEAISVAGVLLTGVDTGSGVAHDGPGNSHVVSRVTLL